MCDFKPIPLSGLPYDVLYIDASAPADHLFDVAEQRLAALEDLLLLLQARSDDMPLMFEVARLASALAPLVGEARQLYALAMRQSTSSM